MLKILPASAEHAETIARLNQAVQQLHLDRAARFFRQPSPAETLEAFRALLTQANTRAFIAYAGEAAVGYVLTMIRERPADAFCPARRSLLIDQISVEPNWRHQGVGRHLMQAVIDYARAADLTELEADTWAFNDTAQAYFRSFGFQPRMIRHWLELKA